MSFVYRELAFTSPQTEERVTFAYDGSISDGVTHNLGEFRFAGVDDKYFQDRALSADSFTFNLLINDQSKLTTTRRLLSEKNTPGKTGVLEHPDPAIGSIPVVVASFKIDQNSLKKMGVAKVSVVFFKTIPNLIGGDPSESANPAGAGATQRAIADHNELMAEEFASAVDDSTGKSIASLINKATSAVQATKTYIGAIATKVDQINTAFTNAYANTLSEIEDLARSPFDLAKQIQNLIQLPMSAIDSAQDRFAAYMDYLDDVLSFSETEEAEFIAGTVSGKNILLVAELVSDAAISAINYAAASTSSVSLEDIAAGEIVSSGYLSRTQISQAIKTVQDSATGATEILSEKSANFGDTLFFKQFFDYSVTAKNIITATVKNLNKRIFSVAKEVTIILEVDTHPVVLAYRLYDSVEINTIQFLIDSNHLHGKEIYLIPKGREIVYYIP